MNLKLIQQNINNTDYLDSIRKASDGADLICLAELGSSGYLYKKREVEPFENIIHSLKEFDCSIMIGIPYQTPHGIYNSYLYYQNGKYQIYNKINLFPPLGELETFLPGEDLVLFDTPFGKSGAVICYDLRFPELFSQLAKMGAEKIFVPAAFPRVRIGDWKELLQKRAKDNNVYILAINWVGNDNITEFGGCSMVVNPEGEIITQADETNESILEVNF